MESKDNIKKLQPSSGTELRPYTKKELRELYGISRATLRTWLSEYDELLGSKYRKLLTVNEVEFIFQKFGIPKKIAA